jgi:hypothetical protein
MTTPSQLHHGLGQDPVRTGLGPVSDRTRTGLGPDLDRTRTGLGPVSDRFGPDWTVWGSSGNPIVALNQRGETSGIAGAYLKPKGPMGPGSASLGDLQ